MTTVNGFWFQEIRLLNHVPCQQFQPFGFRQISTICSNNKFQQTFKAINHTTTSTPFARNSWVGIDIGGPIGNFNINVPCLQCLQILSISSKSRFWPSSLIVFIYVSKLRNSLDTLIFCIKFIYVIKPIKITNLMSRNF